MKASELMAEMEKAIRYNGDLDVTCQAGDSFFPVFRVEYSQEDDEIFLRCKS